MKNSTAEISTIENDTLDAICHAHYGDSSMVAAVYDANPGLAEHPLHLPAGVRIKLPPQEAATIKTKRLWN